MPIVPAKPADLEPVHFDSLVQRKKLSEMLNEKAVTATILYFQPREPQGRLTLRDAVESNVGLWSEFLERVQASRMIGQSREDEKVEKEADLASTFQAKSQTVMGVQMFLNQFHDVSTMDDDGLHRVVDKFHHVAQVQAAATKGKKGDNPVLAISETINNMFTGTLLPTSNADLIQINFVAAYALRQDIGQMIEHLPFRAVRDLVRAWHNDYAGPIAGVRLRFAQKAMNNEKTVGQTVVDARATYDANAQAEATAHAFGEALTREMAKAQIAQAVSEKAALPKHSVN